MIEADAPLRQRRSSMAQARSAALARGAGVVE